MAKHKRKEQRMEQPKRQDVKSVKIEGTDSYDGTYSKEEPVMDDPLLPKKSLFRVEEAAQYFGVARSTIYLWIDHGILKAEKYKLNESIPGGGMIRIPRASLLGCRFNARFDPML